jgi:hypothetical protein
MKTKVVTTNTGMQKFEFTAETASQVAALKAFERVLKTASAINSTQVFFQEDVKVLNVAFQITTEELAQWERAARS